MKTQYRSMPSTSHLDLYFCNVMEALCKNCMSIAYWKVMLQLVKVKESDVCRSLVLSNSVTYVALQETANTHNTLISNIRCELCEQDKRVEMAYVKT